MSKGMGRAACVAALTIVASVVTMAVPAHAEQTCHDFLPADEGQGLVFVCYEIDLGDPDVRVFGGFTDYPHVSVRARTEDRPASWVRVCITPSDDGSPAICLLP